VLHCDTQGDRWHDGHANNRLVCSPYYPPHDVLVARIKGRCVDNSVGLDGCQWQCVRQPEVQSKVDVLGGPPVMAAAVQAEHRLNLARQIGKMATRIDRRFLATSDPLIGFMCNLQNVTLAFEAIPKCIYHRLVNYWSVSQLVTQCS